MKIEELRTRKPWTQEELADACGLNVRTIQRAESGQTIAGKSLKLIAQALETGIGELDIGSVTLDVDLIERKLATQFSNIKLYESEANTRIEIYSRRTLSLWQFAFFIWSSAVFIYLMYYFVWIVYPPMDPKQLFFLQIVLVWGAPFAIYHILKEWLGRISIVISPETMTHQFHIGSIKLIDNSYETDLLSDFKAGVDGWFFLTFFPTFRNYGCYLEFQHGFKTRKIALSNYEAETRFVLSKLVKALQLEQPKSLE